MTSGIAHLTSCFSSAYRGAAAGHDGDEGLEAALEDFWERGRVAWPGVPLEATALAAYLGERAPAEAPLAWLRDQPAADMFVACACAAGLPEAHQAFDATFMEKLGAYLRTLRPTPDLVAETRQILLEKLFVGAPGRAPAIRQFRGEGPLEGWVRIAAVRTALRLRAASLREARRPDEIEVLARAVAPEGDPEIEMLRATYRDDFLVAFRDAVAGLSRRSRAVLRYTFVEHLTPAQIGTVYGCHRTTAMRWIEAARDEVLAATRSRMMERLHLSTSECDHILFLLKSRIDVTLGSLFASASSATCPPDPGRAGST